MGSVKRTQKHFTVSSSGVSLHYHSVNGQLVEIIPRDTKKIFGVQNGTK
jgi:hypothetical protein